LPNTARLIALVGQLPQRLQQQQQQQHLMPAAAVNELSQTAVKRQADAELRREKKRSVAAGGSWHRQQRIGYSGLQQ
jgi:hypothetical protein